MTGFGQNPTTTSQQALATNQFPIPTVAVPGKANGDLTALEGGPESVDTNGNPTAPASMYIKDGNNLAQGATTDTAWSGSGAASEIAILKKLVALLSTALTISGTVTANAGTNMSTAALALETGGNLASLATSNNAVNAAVGSPSDAAWSGSGNGSEIAILKKIVAELAATLTISGTVGVSSLPALASGTNVIGHVVVDSASSVSITALPSLPTGSNLIGNVELVDSGGTNKASIDSAGNQAVKGGFTEQASLSAAASGADLVPSTDVSAYKWFSIHVNANAFVGTLTIQGSNDNTNFVSCFAYNIASGALTSTIASTNQLLAAAITFRYLRIRMTAFTSGAAQGTLELYTSPASWLSVQANQAGNWNINIRDTSANTLNSTVNALWVAPQAETTGGSTPFHLVSAASTNATIVKASAGQVYSYSIINTNAAIRYVHLYNKATSPTVGTDVPVKTFLVPATGQISGSFPVGSVFAIGIALSTTVSSSDTANDAVGAGDLIIDLETK